MKSIILLLTLVWITFNLTAQLTINDNAPDFKLKNIDNKIISLDQYKEITKGIIVIFTCNHCPYAKLYEDRIVELDKEYKTKGFPVIAINPNNPETFEEDSFENMIDRASEKGFTFPYLVDNEGVYQKYGATKTPHVYLLKNDNGKFVVKYIGAIDDNPRDSDNVSVKYLENAINALLSNKELKITETKAIGCSIKPY